MLHLACQGNTEYVSIFELFLGFFAEKQIQYFVFILHLTGNRHLRSKRVIGATYSSKTPLFCKPPTYNSSWGIHK